MTRVPKPPGGWSDHFHLVYDAFNRLVQVKDSDDSTEIAAYEFDGLGRRISETAGGTTRQFYYSSRWQVLEERLGGSTTAERQFVWGDRYIDDLVLRDRDTTNPKNGVLDERLYAMQDANFNVVALAGADGTIQERYLYPGPFGADLVVTGTFGSRGTSSFDWEHRYTARRLDQTTGLYDYRHRPYHAGLGRFPSRDPIGYLGGDPNLYAYLFNDPASAMDPLGLRRIRGTRGRGQLFNDLMAEQAGHRPQYRPIEKTIDQANAVLGVRYDKALAQGGLNTLQGVPNAVIRTGNEAAEQAVSGACAGVATVVKSVVEYIVQPGEEGLIPEIHIVDSWLIDEDPGWHQASEFIGGESVLLLVGLGAEKIVRGAGGGLGWVDDVFRGGSGSRVSGARTLEYSDFEGAERAYTDIRKLTDDVDAIAGNTGMRTRSVQRVKDHLFCREHQLDDAVQRFDADPDIANAWNRLRRGTHTTGPARTLGKMGWRDKELCERIVRVTFLYTKGSSVLMIGERDAVNLLRFFDDLPDPRSKVNRLHRLGDVIVIAVCAVMAAADGPTAIASWAKLNEPWLRKHLALPNGIPGKDTFRRVLGLLNPAAFQQCFQQWLESLSVPTDRESGDKTHIAIDGKTLRRSHDRKNGLGPMHIVSAWASDRGITLGQVATEEKSNEITAIPQLLDLIDVEDAIVTIDAAGCQKNIAAQIVNGKGDYVLALKGNQGKLFDDVCLLLGCHVRDDFADCPVSRYIEAEEGHGRLEERRYYQMTAPDYLHGRSERKGLKTIGAAVRIYHENGVQKTDTRYFLSSLRRHGKRFANAVRNHWAIENTLHWSLDMTYREDESRVRNRTFADNLSWLRRLTLSLIKQHPGKQSNIMKRRMAGWSVDFLMQILTGKGT